ncbi:hydrocephalus-inducing protein homolog [Lonchura striata]
MLFQNFVTHEACEMVVSLINNSKFPQLVKIYMESSPYFQLMCSNNVYRVVTPGVPAHVRIRFTPDENKDYFHELVCSSARERIVVPIRAVGARAILDFPDQLDFPVCPVKYSSQKTLLVRNVSNQAARYQLSTQSPFSVVPTTGILGAGDSMQVTVRFHPLKTGDHSGSLVVCCNTGEESIQTNLHGQAVDLKMGLSTNSVDVGKTFIGMSNHTTVLIENRSNITAHFQWKTLPTEEYENEEKRRQYLLRRRKAVCLENFMEERKMEKFSCRESRLPLHLRGEGQGPLVELSCPSVNLGNILVNNPHICEVKLINQGAINAPFPCIPSTTNVGFFKFAPEEGIITPGEIQTIQISFSATVLGRFEEEVRFSVAGSPVPAILTIKGNVTRPTLHFDLDELSFGDISFGFPYTQSCRLTNTSSVPVTFKLRVLDDGTQPAVNVFDQIHSDSDPSWREGIRFYVEPKEFTMNPSQGTILPQGHQDIEEEFTALLFHQVTLCSNTVMEFCRRMLVDLEGVGEGVASLVITARCLVPELHVYPQVLLYDECQPKVPYQRKFLIADSTNLPGCYGLIPQEHKEDSPVFYSSHKPCGIAQPHSIAEIPVTIEVQTVGKHRTNVLIGVFGDERNPLRSELRSSGQLAKIYPSPRLIVFGRIPALQPTSRNFTLFNKGLIPKDFRIDIIREENTTMLAEDTKSLGSGRSLKAWGKVEKALDPLPEVQQRAELCQRRLAGEARRTEAAAREEILPTPPPNDDLLPFDIERIGGMILDGAGMIVFRQEWEDNCTKLLAQASGARQPLRGSMLSRLMGKHDDMITPQQQATQMQAEELRATTQAAREAIRAASRVVAKPSPWSTVRQAESESFTQFVDRLQAAIDSSTLPAEAKGPVVADCLRQQCNSVTKDILHSLPAGASLADMIRHVVREEHLTPIQAAVHTLTSAMACFKRQPAWYLHQRISQHSLQYLHTHYHRKQRLCRGPCKPHCYTIEPREGVIPARGQVPVTVTAALDDTGLFADTIQLFTGDSLWTACRLVALDTGSTIVIDKPFAPELNLGCQFSFLPCIHRFKVTNRGHHFYQLFWSAGCYSPPEEGGQGISALSSPKDDSQSPKRAAPMFALEPPLMKLQPGESADLVLRGFSRVAQEVQDYVMCEAVRGIASRREKIIETVLICKYIDPSIEISARQFSFHVEKKPSDDLTRQYQPLSLKNTCLLPLDLMLDLEQPFLVCDEDQQPLPDGQIFNEIGHSTVTLVNTGKIEFIWTLNPSAAGEHLPGVFLVNPTTGSIAPGEKQVLKFSYVPGLPGAFKRTYQLKVGDLDPENILLKGEASCPMISVNLPWNITGNEKHEKPLKQLVKPLHQYSRRSISAVRKKSQTLMTETLKTLNPKTRDLKPRYLGSGTVPSSQLQIDTMRTLIEKADLELQQKLTYYPPKSRFPDKELCQSLVKVELPEYVLDMGPVHKGHIERSTLEITNPGQIPVSFQVDVSVLPDTGKTEIAAGLCQYYDAAYISIDTVVKEAMANDGSPAGLSARELCTNAAMEPKGKDKGNAGKKPHLTAQTKNKQAPGEKINKKDARGKNPPAQKKVPASKPNIKDTKCHDLGWECALADSSTASQWFAGKVQSWLVWLQAVNKVLGGCTGGLQSWVSAGQGMGPPGPSPGAPSLHCRAVLVCTREEPQLQAQQWELFRAFHRGFFSLQWSTLQFTVSTAPAPQQLNITSSGGEELNFLSCVLPKDLLVDILSERLKGKDCYKGVVFDGLETLFASSLESSLLCVLRAVKNCHHIYMVNLHQDYASWKAKEEAERKRKKAQTEKEELQQKKAIQRNREHVLQMDEDEYDTLPEEKKAEVDKIIPETKTIQMEGELKEVAQKLEKEAKDLGEEERQKEEEKQKKENIHISVGKQPEKPQKEAKAPEKKETKKRGTKTSGKEETKAPEKGEANILGDPAEMENLILRFQIYESSQQNIAEVFSSWDRVQGTMQLPMIQKGNKSQPSGENKGLKKTSKPQEKVKKPERERVGQRSLQSSQLGMQSEAAEGAVSDKHVGVPCLDIQVSDPKAMIREILRDGKLPTEDQVKPCKAEILILPWWWALEHCVPQVIMAQSLVQAPDDVPQWLCTICVDGEVITIPQMGRKYECFVYKCPICSEFPSPEIIINSPKTGQLIVIVFFR